MNYPKVFRILGWVLVIECAFMLPALGIAFAQGESEAAHGFILAVVIGVAFGLLLTLIPIKQEGYFARDGLVTVGLSWIALSLVGAIPFSMSGAIPSYLDSFFETVSGFTTTGASILPEVESLPRSLLYWRCFTNWLGGMGVLVFLLAMGSLGKDSGESLYLLRAEAPGVRVSKIVPRMRKTALILYGLYIGMSLLMFLLLLPDMPVFDALTTTFATGGTGGFSVRNGGMLEYSIYSQIIVTVFMILFSVNFSVYFLLVLGRFRMALRNEELWVFLGLLAAASLIIFFDIRPLFATAGEALGSSTFTVASVMSTTGLYFGDYELWPALSRAILLCLMFFGACGGSTCGGMKLVRIILINKIAVRTVRRTIHPQEVRSIHMDGEALDEETVDSAGSFVLVYFLLVIALTILLSIDGQDFLTTFSSMASCLNNVGPAMGAAGPTLNYACFSGFGKLVLCFAMLLGRLELYPILMLFIPATWKK